MSSATKKQPAYPCSECDEDPEDASTCCFECQALLCPFHTEAHARTRLTKNHKLEKVSDLPPIAQTLATPALNNVPIDDAAPIFSTSSSSTASGWEPNNHQQSNQWWGQQQAPPPQPTYIVQPIAVPVVMANGTSSVMVSPHQIAMTNSLPILPPPSPLVAAQANITASLPATYASAPPEAPTATSAPASPVGRPPVVPPRPSTKPPSLTKPPSSPSIASQAPPPSSSSTASPQLTVPATTPAVLVSPSNTYEEVYIRCASDPNLVLDVNYWFLKIGSRLQLNLFHGGKSQRWKFAPNGTLVNMADDQTWCAEVPWGKVHEAPIVIVFKAHGGPSCRWSLDSHGRIRSAVNPGFVLDAADADPQRQEDPTTLACRALTVKRISEERPTQLFVLEPCEPNLRNSNSAAPNINNNSDTTHSSSGSSSSAAAASPRSLPKPPAGATSNNAGNSNNRHTQKGSSTGNLSNGMNGLSLGSAVYPSSGRVSPVAPLSPSRVAPYASPAAAAPPPGPVPPSMYRTNSNQGPTTSAYANANISITSESRRENDRILASAPAAPAAQFAANPLAAWVQLATTGMAQSQSQPAQVSQNREAAQQMLSHVESHGVFGNASQRAPHLGAPENLAELSDLLLEAALLPSPANVAMGQAQAPLPQKGSVGPARELHPMLKAYLASPAFQAQQKQMAQQAMPFLTIEPEQRWLQIPWRRTAREALAEAQRSGGRVMRCKALSDARVIQAVNQSFVPLGVNVTRDGFPPELPAMKLVEPIYTSNWRFEFGFASCLMLDSDGAVFVGTTSAKSNNFDQFSPERFLAAIQQALIRFEKVKEAKRHPGSLIGTGFWVEYWKDLAKDFRR